MEIRSFTAVDSVYEYFGYTIGHTFYQTLATIHLPAMLAIAGVCLVFHRAMGRGSWGQLIGYVLYLLIALWLITPADVSVGPPMIDDSAGGQRPTTIKAPRFLAYTHLVTDNVVASGISKASPNFETAAHHWVRLAAASRNARILDADLRRHFADFVVDCYMPALARYPKTGQTIYPTDEPEDFETLYEVLQGRAPDGEAKSCKAIRTDLREQLRDHLWKNQFHSDILGSFARLKLGQSGDGSEMSRDEFDTYYYRRVVYNEAFYYTDATEMALLDKAVPPYHWYDTSQNTRGYAADSEPEDEGLFGTITGLVKKGWEHLKSGVSSFIRGVAGVVEWVDQQASGPMLYYRVTLYAPYIYGLVLMLLLVSWPIPAIWSLWPGHNPQHPFNFHPLLNYLKVFISVKLWPFFWSLLASFNTARQWLPGDGASGAQGDEMYHAFSAIAAMYIIVPAFSFLIIQLTTKAGSVAVANFGGMGAPGAGGVGGMAQQSIVQGAEQGGDQLRKGLGYMRGLSSGAGGAGAGGGAPPAAA